MGPKDKFKKALNHAIQNIVEEGPEDTAAWEHRAYLHHALEEIDKNSPDALETAEDALGWSVDKYLEKHGV